MDKEQAAKHWTQIDRSHIRTETVNVCFFRLHNPISFVKEYRDNVQDTISPRATIAGLSYERIIYSIFGNI